MKAIINNIIDFYCIQAENLNVLLSITQRTLDESKKERKTNEQIQRVENFVKDLTMDLNNMLAKFYFLKARKNRTQEQMTDRQLKAIAEFTVFVKTLTKNVCSLLKRFEESQAFEEKIDKEIKELEVSVQQKLKEFDKALDEPTDTLTTRLFRFTRNTTGRIGDLFQAHSLVLAVANRRKTDKLPEKTAQNIEKNFSAQNPNTNDDRLENLFKGPNIKSVESNEKKSENLMHLRA